MAENLYCKEQKVLTKQGLKNWDKIFSKKKKKKEKDERRQA